CTSRPTTPPRARTAVRAATPATVRRATALAVVPAAPAVRVAAVAPVAAAVRAAAVDPAAVAAARARAELRRSNRDSTESPDLPAHAGRFVSGAWKRPLMRAPCVCPPAPGAPGHPTIRRQRIPPRRPGALSADGCPPARDQPFYALVRETAPTSRPSSTPQARHGLDKARPKRRTGVQTGNQPSPHANPESRIP